jgi:large subunit ribosomal protein L25
MKAAITFEASMRTNSGKGAARAIRREGNVPAVIYADGKAGDMVTLSSNALTREYRRGGFMSKIVEIKTDKQSFYALPKEILFHPVTDVIEHADFLRVTETSTIKVRIPVHFLNQDKCIGIKRGGMMNVVRHDLELICNISDIPSHIDIDMQAVNIGDSIHISHVTLPKGATPAIRNRDFTVVTVAGRGGKSDVEEDAAAPKTAEVVATKVKAVDGAAKPAAKPAAKK